MEEVQVFLDSLSTPTCECRCGYKDAGQCGHKWDGPEVATYHGAVMGPIENFIDKDSGLILDQNFNGSSVACSLCGMTAEAHDMRVLP